MMCIGRSHLVLQRDIILSEPKTKTKKTKNNDACKRVQSEGSGIEVSTAIKTISLLLEKKNYSKSNVFIIKRSLNISLMFS